MQRQPSDDLTQQFHTDVKCGTPYSRCALHLHFPFGSNAKYLIAILIWGSFGSSVKGKLLRCSNALANYTRVPPPAHGQQLHHGTSDKRSLIKS